MKTAYLLLALLFSTAAFAQNSTSVAHGTVYGTKPDITGVMDASKIETFMGNKTRVTIAVKGKVLKVTNPKGGWFDMDAGNGKVISAHFSDYKVNIPADLKGHTVVMNGIAQKQFIADDKQHFAGDTVKGKKQSQVKTDPKHRLTFEVKGLMVD